jgi:hypothetical protein
MWNLALHNNCVEISRHIIKLGYVVTEKDLSFIASDKSAEMFELLLQNSNVVNCKTTYFYRNLIHEVSAYPDFDSCRKLSCCPLVFMDLN